jgi:hypothetical protein
MPSPQEREAALFALALERPVTERSALRESPTSSQCHPEFGTSSTAPTVKATIKLDLADAPDEAVGQTLGRYKLLERVGEGGCGVVYVAEQTEPVRRRVALKVIKLGMDTKPVVARFEAERQALAMMDHPNLAKVLDAGTTGESQKEEGRMQTAESSSHLASSFNLLPSAFPPGRPYFVRELVRGIKITDYCDQANLSTEERLDLFIKVCQAIQHAHQKGKHDVDAGYRLYVMNLLGASLSGQKKYADAQTFLLQGYEGLQQRQASLPPYLNAPRRITESLERLVQLDDAWGKPAQAAEWKQKLAAFQQANKVSDSKSNTP